VIPFFGVINFTKLAQFSKNYRTFYPKNCHEALKYMGLGSGIRDPVSEIQDPAKTIPDPGIKKAPDPGSGSATLVMWHCLDLFLVVDALGCDIA
jgi:hypothetical protein